MTTVEEKAKEFEEQLREILKNEPYQTATKLRVQRLWNGYFRNCKPLQMPKVFIYFMRYEAVNGIKDLMITATKENEVVYSNFEKCSMQEYGDANVEKAVEGFCFNDNDVYIIYITKSTREHEDDILKHELGHVIENQMQRLIDSGKISYVKNQDGDCDLSKPFLVHEYNG